MKSHESLMWLFIFYKKINLIRDSKKCDINYQDLVFWIKSNSCKLFFLTNATRLVVRRLSNGIQPLSELSIVEIDLNITPGEEKHSKKNIYANVS